MILTVRGNPTSLVLLACLLFPVMGFGQGVELAVHTGAGVTDNASRLTTGNSDETIAEVGVDLSVGYVSRRIEANANGDFVYQDYLKDTFDDDVIGGFVGDASFAIAEDRLFWKVEDSFGQSRQDFSEALTPANRENINAFSTGPELVLNFAGDMKAEAFARYRQINYEETPLDSERYAGGFALSHQFSNASTLGIHWEIEKVEYTQLISAADYDRQDAFLRYELTNSRSDLTIDLGANRVDGVAGESTGPVTRISYTRKLSEKSTLWVVLNRELTDAGINESSLVRYPTSDPSDLSVSQTSEPFTNEYGMVGWQFSGRRTDMEIAASRSDEKYTQTTGIDRVRDQYTFDARRQMGSGWSMSLSGRHERNDFESTDPDYQETSVALAIAKQFSRQFFFDIAYERFERKSDLATSEYDENRLWFRLRYGTVRLAHFGSPKLRAQGKQ